MCRWYTFSRQVFPLLYACNCLLCAHMPRCWVNMAGLGGPFLLLWDDQVPHELQYWELIQHTCSTIISSISIAPARSQCNYWWPNHKIIALPVTTRVVTGGDEIQQPRTVFGGAGSCRTIAAPLKQHTLRPYLLQVRFVLKKTTFGKVAIKCRTKICVTSSRNKFLTPNTASLVPRPSSVIVRKRI